MFVALVSHLVHRSIEHLALDGNGIGGTSPPEIINLVNLKELSLEANALTGSIPLELIELTNLEVLELSDNILTGFIPSEIGLLKELGE
jgi:Leucine-rich repeat (LRR) protein